MKIIIIGAGLGGLSAAIYLLKDGHDVHVFETNSVAGGKAGNISADGYRFDTGPSLLTLPVVLQNIFKDCGEDINNYLQIKKLDVLTKNFYEDGRIIYSYSDIEKFAKEIEEKTLDTKESVNRFFKYTKAIYDASADVFIFNSLSKFLKPSVKNLRYLPKVTRLDSLRSMHKSVSSFFTDRHSQQIFDRFATYNGSNPYQVPATLNVISYVEHFLGGYYVADGIYSIPNALLKLAKKKGAKFHFNSEVTEIVKKNNSVIGIKVNDKFYNADKVVSNADVNFTFRNLLNDDHSSEAKRYKALEPSSSAFVFNWGIADTFSELDIHNIFFSEDYKHEFDQLFYDKTLPDDPTVYVNISSKYNQNDAPKGKENWFVLINAPYDSGQDWNTHGLKLKDKVIEKIERILRREVRSKIEFEKILTPKDIENQTKSSFGSLYGISSNTMFAAFFRQQAKSKTYKNLYFCGGSAHPGGGIPLVLISGKLAAEAITGG